MREVKERSAVAACWHRDLLLTPTDVLSSISTIPYHCNENCDKISKKVLK